MPYQVKARGKKSAEVLLYDEIGNSFWGGVSAKQLQDDLAKLGEIDTINLRINSPGGDVFEAFTMYNNFARHPAQVLVDIDGMAFSAASVVAMAGDEIRMADNAMFMIHNPSTTVYGGADDMMKMADVLNQVKGNIVTTYEKQTKLDTAELEQLMDDETWFTADQALAKGFIDRITDSLNVEACFDPRRFRHPPPGFMDSRRSSSPRLDAYRGRLAEVIRSTRG